MSGVIHSDAHHSTDALKHYVERHAPLGRDAIHADNAEADQTLAFPIIPVKTVSLFTLTNKQTNSNKTTTWTINFNDGSSLSNGDLAVVSVFFKNSGTGANKNYSGSSIISNKSNPPTITIPTDSIGSGQKGTIDVTISNTLSPKWQGQGTVAWTG